MKRHVLTLAVCLALIAMLPACNLEGIGIPSDAHDAAVQKVSEYVENAINKKIDKSENLSDAGKAKLKAEVAKLKEEILVRIAKIKEKAEAGDTAENAVNPAAEAAAK